MTSIAHPSSCAVVYFLLLVLSVSCNEKELSKSKLQYFDLARFVSDEAKKLTAQKLQVEKTVFLNGKEEKKRVMIDNWTNELNAFKDADINKKSFLSKFMVDSIRNDDNLLIRYTALDKKFRTRELSIQYDADKNPKKITATVLTSNVLYSSNQQLIYETGKGYWISGKQAIRFLESDSFYVNVRF